MQAGATQQLTAAVADQFGAAITSSTVTWSVPAAAGTITTGGLFTAGATPGTYAVTATDGSAVGMASVTVLPAVSSVSLSPASVTGGSPSTGTVTLSGPAPTGGTTVTLTSSSASATVPATVTVPAGSSSATFPVATSAVSSAAAATLSAAAGGATKTATLTINPIVALTAPVDLSAYATGSGNVTLYWTQIPGATGYNVYRGTAAGGEDYAHPVNGATPVSMPSYPGSGMDIFSDTGLTNGTAYFYTIEAVAGSGSSQKSNEDSDTPTLSAIPWDSRNPGAVLSAFRSAFSGDEPYLPNLRVVGPDGTIYDDAYGTAQLPDGTLDPNTNQVTLPDGSTTTLFNDTYDPQQMDAAVPAAAGLASPNAMQGLLLPPGNGPYRRVQTTPGWRGVQGYVTLPNSVTIGASTINPTTGASTDAPHIYLGLHDGVDTPHQDVDAGLLYQNASSSWQPFMRINGVYTEPDFNALINVPTGGVRFYGGATVALRYYAYNQSYVGNNLTPYKASLLVVDGTLYGSESDFRSLGGATRLVPGDLPNIRMKRVQALAQKTGLGVTETGSSFIIPLWDMGNLLTSSGSLLNWTPTRTGTTRQGQYDDGSYDGTSYGTPPTGAGANVSWTPYHPIPYYREDNTSISIFP